MIMTLGTERKTRAQWWLEDQESAIQNYFAETGFGIWPYWLEELIKGGEYTLPNRSGACMTKKLPTEILEEFYREGGVNL